MIEDVMTVRAIVGGVYLPYTLFFPYYLFHFASLHFASLRFASFRFASFRFVSFRFVLFIYVYIYIYIYIFAIIILPSPFRSRNFHPTQHSREILKKTTTNPPRARPASIMISAFF